MCSNLIINTIEKRHRRRPGAFTVNVEQRIFTLLVCPFYLMSLYLTFISLFTTLIFQSDRKVNVKHICRQY